MGAIVANLMKSFVMTLGCVFVAFLMFAGLMLSHHENLACIWLLAALAASPFVWRAFYISFAKKVAPSSAAVQIPQPVNHATSSSPAPATANPVITSVNPPEPIAMAANPSPALPTAHVPPPRIFYPSPNSTPIMPVKMPEQRKPGTLKNLVAICAIIALMVYIYSLVDKVRQNDLNLHGGGAATGASASEYVQGQTVHVGYTSYSAWKSWWSKQLSSNQFLNEKPNAEFLFVDLTVRNDDKKARWVAPFKLVDENNAEYDASAHAMGLKGSIGLIENLNPGVSKQGFIVFDVPTAHTYRLKVSGGIWSASDAFIKLNPQSANPDK